MKLLVFFDLLLSKSGTKDWLLCPIGGPTCFNGSTFQAKATRILTDAGISSDKINAFKAAMIE